MPRTKQVKKKSSVMRKRNEMTFLANSMDTSSMECTSDAVPMLVQKSYGSLEDLKKELKMFTDKKIEAQEIAYRKACEHVKSMITQHLNSIPDSVRRLKFPDYLSEGNFNKIDQNTDPNITIASHSRPSRSRKPVESFQFKKPRTPTETTSRRASSRKRSASASAPTAPKPVSDSFKTPLMSNRRLPPGSVITPKMSDTPMSVLRRPLQGEVAVSMSGSPLMVGAVSREDIPTVNVPLLDGRIFSIMPERGDPPLELPEFDETTRQYLRTLREHLEILAPRTP